MTITLAKWTIADYHQLIAAGCLEGRHVELLNGAIIEMPPEAEPHSASSTVARDYLIRQLGERAIIREGHPITLPASNSEPEPDLAIVRVDAADYWERHPYPEDIYWIVEFASSSLSKDLDPKAKVYAAAGIAEYWVANLKTTQLIVMRDPSPEGYQSSVTYNTGSVQPLAFSDLELEVSRLFRRPV